MFLTVYALIGDDFRLLFFGLAEDRWFDYVVIFCMTLFVYEIVISCLGKDDYFLGFFFILDVIATGTMVLDLSWVANYMNGGAEEDDQMSSLRGGRTARVGAKAGRIVRVIRLVRIIKLYKGVYDSWAARQQQMLENRLASPGGRFGDLDDDMDDDDASWAVDSELHKEETKEPAQESRVGKKLSEMTIRRVIVLVLMMLLTFTFVRFDDAENAQSGTFGADIVWQTFDEHLQARSVDRHRNYQEEMLSYIFYHNWFAQDSEFCPTPPCAGDYASHLFWVGVMGEDITIVQEMAKEAQLQEATVQSWAAEIGASQKGMYNYGTMPSEALAVLSSPLDRQCDTKTRKLRGFSLLQREISGVLSTTLECPDELRLVEREMIWPKLMPIDQLSKSTICFWFDLRPFVRLEAWFSLALTFFICVVLCCAAVLFSMDANQLVLMPVENMIKRVEAIRDNPLRAVKMAEEEFKAEEVQRGKEMMRRESSMRKVKQFVFCRCRAKPSEPMETVILEKTIIKLGSLLALGFGEAGSDIIAHTMQGEATGGINIMSDGRRCDCILGIARIGHFHTATEVLQAKIMTFVNEIAEIVHGVVDEFQGAPNKNNGETFLLVWQLAQGPELTTKKQRLLDMSVIAFTKVVYSVHRSPVLARYRRHPGLQQRLGTFRVNLTLGLHCGWAIEGAVGSEYKIDASYVSPNVSITTALERATHTYGVIFIVAQSVVEKLTPTMASKCRRIDNAILEGSQTPIQIFAVDLDPYLLEPDDSAPLKIHWNARRRFQAKQYLETEKSSRWNDANLEIVSLFEEDKHIKVMRRPYSEEFNQLFIMGYHNYHQGEWGSARRYLERVSGTLGDNSEDGPSKALLLFMEGYNFEAPRDWSGVRNLSQADGAAGGKESDRAGGEGAPLPSTLKA